MTALERLELVREKAVAKMNEIIEAYSARFTQGAEESEATTAADKAIEDSAEELAVETPRAKGVVPAEEPKARKNLNGGINRSQLVRDFFVKNKNARNKDAVAFLKAEHNVVVSPELVSIVRTKLGIVRTKPGAMREKGENRSELIRNFFEKNTEARNKDAIKFLREKGVKVSPDLVSSVRSRLGMKTTRKKVEKVKALRVKTRKSDLPLTAIVTRALKGSRNGYKLAELADLSVKAGYQYGGDRGRDGIIANVYQAVRSLHEKKYHPGWAGETSVVMHDVESKRWKLNPKAKRIA